MFALLLQTSEIQNEFARHSSFGANGKIILCDMVYDLLHITLFVLDKTNIIPQHLYSKVKSSSSPDMFEIQDTKKKPHR